MRELIKAKEEVAVETEENASEEIIVAPDPVLMSVLMSKSNPEASAVRHASHHAEKHHHNKRKVEKQNFVASATATLYFFLFLEAGINFCK